MLKPLTLLLGGLLAASLPLPAAADNDSFLENWKFTRTETRMTDDPSAWETVSIPHGWNAIDATDGGSDSGKAFDAYYRGPGWYAKTFATDPAWKDQRVFLRFEGASTVANVYLNGKHLGEHRGGFGAFIFEVTDKLAASGENELRVRVDNFPHKDIAPLSGDFPVFGGLYRPVRILTKPQTCITPLDYASPGVYISQKKVTDTKADVSVLTKVSHAGDKPVPVSVNIRVLDGEKEIVKSASGVVEVKKDADITVPLTVDKPRLWNGREDPHLYTVEITLASGGKTLDTIRQPLGLRYYSVDPEKGFFLNGKPYRLYGVNRHQDRDGKGWAISKADIEEDQRLIYEMGARAIRLAHYPHPSLAYELCDRDGLLAWAEIPIVSKIDDSKEFAANARQQLIEMIRQHYNHPSIFTWGIFNEIYMAPSPKAGELVKELNALAKKEDPTRPTIAGTHKYFPDICDETDLLGFNEYPGWYWGKPEDMIWKLKDFLRDSGKRGACVSEYGSGASVKQHEIPAKMPKHNGPWHPEEWQGIMHEAAWDAIINNPTVWGSFVWNMYDFASDWRNEGDRLGINDKGLVTWDRKTRKDTYFFYKANWTPEPLVYITSRRFVNRTDSVTPVKIYTNAPEAELFVNGKSLGKKQPDSIRRITWENVTLQPGKNDVEVKATKGGKQVIDSVTWTLGAGTES